MTFLCVTLLGYALFGKGFAYLGVPPIYIGEVVLFCGAIAFLAYGNCAGIFDVPAAWCLALLLVWGSFRLLPDLPAHGTVALRDAVFWGYGTFALLVLRTSSPSLRDWRFYLQVVRQVHPNFFG